MSGLGLGDSRQKLFFLPEAHTDFILSIVGEELGLIGIGFVVALFAVLVWRGLRTAWRARDSFGCYLAFGITAMFGLQALVNIGVVLGSLPTKGLPLPFISYGGSSLVVSFFMAGVLANISARRPEPRDRPWWSLTSGSSRGSNKRVHPGPRIVIDVGPPPRSPRKAKAAPTTPEALTGAGDPSPHGGALSLAPVVGGAPGTSLSVSITPNPGSTSSLSEPHG